MTKTSKNASNELQTNNSLAYGGFVYLYRSLEDMEWYHDAKTVHLFIHCLMKANYTDKQWKDVTVPRGSFISSLAKLSEATGLSIQSVRTALGHLKSTHCLTYSGTPRYTLFKVENYDELQGGNMLVNKQLTTTNNNKQKSHPTAPYVYKDFQGSEDPSEALFGRRDPLSVIQEKYSDPDLVEMWSDYFEIRTELKLGNRRAQVRALIDQLEELAQTDKDRIRIIRQSVINEWKQFFPLSTRPAGHPKYVKKTPLVPDYYDPDPDSFEPAPPEMVEALKEQALQLERQANKKKEAPDTCPFP